MSSQMHAGGRAKLKKLAEGYHGINYSDSKLHMVMLAKAVARLWPKVCANAIDPGWVPTKMGGAGAPDSLQKGYQTQVWLATSDEAAAKVSGQYFFHLKSQSSAPEADELPKQEEFLRICEGITGVKWPS